MSSEIAKGYCFLSLWLLAADRHFRSLFSASAISPQLWLIILILLIGVVLGGGLYHVLFSGWLTRKAQQAARRDIEKIQQMERERIRSIYELISTMTATLKYNRVLDIALDLGGKALTAGDSTLGRMVSAVLLFSESRDSKPELRVGSARRFTPADFRVALPAAEGVLARVIAHGEPELCTDIARDPELRRFVALRACQVAYILPLRTGLDVYGVLLYAHPDPGFFTASQRDTLQIIARQAVIAIQNARLYSDLEQEKERMMEIQEEARRKLSRDLHDGPTQSVAAIAMRLNFVRRVMEKDVKTASEEVGRIEELARRTTKEIRHMLFTLRPLVLESQGLQAALVAMADKMRDTFDQNVLIDVDPKVVTTLESAKQTVIFYIAEEAVNNARKYAQASHIWVRLKPYGSDMALLEIEDDGIGFNVGEVDASYEKRGSFGMVNMRERAELVNGMLKVNSAEGKGTTIQVLIPLTEEAAEQLRQGAG